WMPGLPARGKIARSQAAQERIAMLIRSFCHPRPGGLPARLLGLIASIALPVVGCGALAADSPSATGSASQPTPEYTLLQERPDRLIVELPNRMIVIAQELPAAPVVSA